MTDHLTDEQQVELLKNFWHEYGLSIILGITLALCAGFGFKYYQSYVTQRSYQASVVYERFVVGLMNGEMQESGVLAQDLKDKFSRTPYAKFAAFALAKNAVIAKDYQEAISELNWVKEHSDNTSMKQVAVIRLARIYLEQQKPEEALSILNTVKNSGYASLIYEVKGDAYTALDKVDAAKKSYSTALDKLPEGAINKPILEMKLYNLPVS